MSKLPGEASDAPSVSDLPSVIGGRYRVEKLLGRGGMAMVFAAHDPVRRKSVALKRLLPLQDPSKQRRNHELFEREYHLLSQLAHPHIVKVYDFAFDAGEAYYTMEMLGGRDLQQLAPMPWRDACAAARDVCSALSLLHSRRLLHRDLSPRNVYWQGTLAKLIDFGVTVAMGPNKLLVGTPPCCAPENVHLQSLDGRSDLFALGATLYFALVGRHAYAAPRFSNLHEAWRRGFPRPSELVATIPEALDALVIDLLHLDRDARPANAAEVIERLVAIDGALANEALHTAAAYLATPPLVGRDAELERVRRRLENASIIIQGRSGVGRTRLLDASVLGATLAGRTVVRCDADDAQSGEYGVARAIMRQLFELLPLEAAATAAAYEAQLASIVLDNPAAPSVSRPQLQQALHSWLVTLHQRHSFVLAIDDIHRIDEPSASMLALLQDSADTRRPSLLLSAEADARWTAPAAQNLLVGVSVLKLRNLSASECEKLLGTLFGDDAPNLELLAARTFAVCAGNPGDLLRLVQHLIDRGLIRYAAGAWALPSEIDSGDLPASLAQALSTRIAGLDDSARRLGQALALCPDEKLDLDECALVCGEANRSRLLSACEQLTLAEIARRVDERITLSHASWVPLLRATLTQQEQLTLETTLASVIERRPDQDLRAAQHWLRGGDAKHALDLLVAHSASSQEKTARSPEVFAAYLRTLPADWYEMFDQAIALCDELDRPKKHKLVLLSRLSGILPMLNMFAPAHTMALFESLKHDSGLEDWEALSAETDPAQRLKKALGQARARYDATPESERVNEPAAAIQHLTRAVVGAGGSVMLSLDLPHLRSWPQLQPLALLSPAIDVAVKLVAGIDARLAGRTVRAQQLYLDLLSMVQRPDRAGMDASHAGYIALGIMNGLGMLAAMTGAERDLVRPPRARASTASIVSL